MKLEFLGTRGEIEARTDRHRMHTALMVGYRGRRVLIDCGADWREEVHRLRPPAIVLTHAHPDHAWGLEDGAPCPVYATPVTWRLIDGYPIEKRYTIAARKPFSIGAITFEAFDVEHSTRCPAVGYRITAGRVTVFYAPDLVYIHERDAALRGCKAYIGDGATPAQSFVRKRGDRLIGHSPVRTQLTWCEKEGVPRAVITHCGKQIVEGDEASIESQLNQWGRERGVEVTLAFDGLELTLR